MKNFILALALIGSSHAFAASYHQAGCGLGSMVFKEEGSTQILAATTNGTFGSQTFGISSGTSNCSGAGGVATTDAQEHMYVETNRSVINQEMAQGSGEHLNALATMLGCQKGSSTTFAAVMKKNYKVVASKKSTDEMLQSMRNVISSDSRLNKSCQG